MVLKLSSCHLCSGFLLILLCKWCHLHDILVENFYLHLRLSLLSLFPLPPQLIRPGLILSFSLDLLSVVPDRIFLFNDHLFYKTVDYIFVVFSVLEQPLSLTNLLSFIHQLCHPIILLDLYRYFLMVHSKGQMKLHFRLLGSLRVKIDVF